MNCILCKSEKTLVVNKLNNSVIIDLYKERSKTNVDRFFQTQTTEILNCLECNLLFYNPLATGDGPFYDELQRYKDYYMSEKTEYTEAAKFIKETDNVLEIGCGYGNFRGFINCNSYTGLEFSEDAIISAVNRGLNVTNERLADHIKTNEAKYDVVCFFQVLEHVENPHIFISDSIKCLKPGGKLILAVPSEDSFIKDASNFYLNLPPHHTTKWKDVTLQRIAKIFDLNIIYLFHEPLINAHKLFYLKTKINKFILGIFGIESSSVGKSIIIKYSYIVSSLISIIINPFFKGSKKTGQSVLAVYNKKPL